MKNHIDETLMILNNDELLIKIGVCLEQGSIHIKEPNDDFYKKRASIFLKSILPSMTKKICFNRNIKTLADNGKSVALATAILSLIEGIVAGTAAVPIAVLLCQMGVEKICETYWTQPNE